ncbi:Rossmann-like alpha/beta/alpha sandwich fold containing protein, partial [Pseudoloma neurophilia]
FFTVQKLLDDGYTLVACLYIKSHDLDSFMYQTAGQDLVENYQHVLNVPFYIFETEKVAINKNLKYSKTENDEVEVMYRALDELKTKYDFQYVSAGAIKSEYQYERVKNVCSRLELQPLTPIYNQNQITLFNEIEKTLDAIFVKIATTDLNKSVIGKKLSAIKNLQIENKCGEGGEYETLVLDAPFFKKKLEILSYDIECHPEDIEKEFQTVFFLTKAKIQIIPK